MRNIGVGLIGLGSIGQVHLKNGLRVNNARIVAVSDVSKKALSLARDCGVKKTYLSYEQLLNNPEVDCVIIALPTHLHQVCIEKAAEARKHILLEKPIGRSVEEAKRIISASKRNSVTLMLGYPLRFNPDFSKVKEEVTKGIFGDVPIAYATNVSFRSFFP